MRSTSLFFQLLCGLCGYGSKLLYFNSVELRYDVDSV